MEKLQIVKESYIILIYFKAPRSITPSAFACLARPTTSLYPNM